LTGGLSEPAYHRQCELRRPSERGEWIQVSWIPAIFAKKGKQVTLKDGVWTVTQVWAKKASREVHDDAHLHTKHRKGRQEM